MKGKPEIADFPLCGRKMQIVDKGTSRTLCTRVGEFSNLRVTIPLVEELSLFGTESSGTEAYHILFDCTLTRSHCAITWWKRWERDWTRQVLLNSGQASNLKQAAGFLNGFTSRRWLRCLLKTVDLTNSTYCH
ncbi:hypothetical protein PRIPAC_76736 [Pristionchus pacificus]|uniref:Uncharacterized protein n=1 Tax=Pristionchus pacificus TaxID=54126 RepID=A0A2A6BXS2_PRIPA|nr:hypothetical protein PRIPAC_76736 [Pristionchus pacificus]|eukprot:PDM70573.1 hypothetical protein PRIPAC_46819 [Pristionchus pacificus]